MGRKGGHDWTQPTQRGGPTPSSSISVCTRLMDAQLPSNRRKAKLSPLYPGMVTVAPGGVPATLLYTGVCTTLVLGFLKLTKSRPECMGLTFVLYWSFSSLTYPFSATPSCRCYCSCLIILGLTPNMRKNVNGIYVIKIAVMPIFRVQVAIQ